VAQIESALEAPRAAHAGWAHLRPA
jgi:hypothetical protein